jgi:hypothetical protein
MRAEVSLMPPGGHGTISLIGRLGKSCAAAMPAVTPGGMANVAIRAARDHRAERCMKGFLDFMNDARRAALSPVTRVDAG